MPLSKLVAPCFSTQLVEGRFPPASLFFLSVSSKRWSKTWTDSFLNNISVRVTQATENRGQEQHDKRCFSNRMLLCFLILFVCASSEVESSSTPYESAVIWRSSSKIKWSVSSSICNTKLKRWTASNIDVQKRINVILNQPIWRWIITPEHLYKKKIHP